MSLARRSCGGDRSSRPARRRRQPTTAEPAADPPHSGSRQPAVIGRSGGASCLGAIATGSRPGTDDHRGAVKCRPASHVGVEPAQQCSRAARGAFVGRGDQHGALAVGNRLQRPEPHAPDPASAWSWLPAVVDAFDVDRTVRRELRTGRDHSGRCPSRRPRSAPRGWASRSPPASGTTAVSMGNALSRCSPVEDRHRADGVGERCPVRCRPAPAASAPAAIDWKPAWHRRFRRAALHRDCRRRWSA